MTLSYYEVVLRIGIAILIGGMIGYERSLKNRPAGFITHILVCVGATVISLIQVQSIAEVANLIKENPILESALKADVGRMGAQVITGIGFLGAGTIIQEKRVVKGLTTAATLWVVACIGLAIGMGYYFISIAAVIGVVVCLVVLKRVEKFLFFSDDTIEISMKNIAITEFVEHIKRYFAKRSVEVQSIEVLQINNACSDGTREVESSFVGKFIVHTPKSVQITDLVEELSYISGVESVKIL